MPSDEKQENLKNSLRRLFEIAFPPAVTELLTETMRPEPDFRRITRIIGMDPAIAAAVLSLVNSAWYGLPGKITDLNRAALLLGSKEIARIALTVSLQDGLLHRTQNDTAAYFAAWRRIVWSAVAAELLAGLAGREHSEHAYLAALLKDVSLLIASGLDDIGLSREERSSLLDYLIRSAPRPDDSDPDPAEALLGDGHGHLTASILQGLPLPDPVLAAIVAHHDIDNIQAHAPATRAVILSTRWAELELGDSPAALVQFEQGLKSILKLDDSRLESLRADCASRYEVMLATLHIRESGPARGYYRHTLAAMQRYFFMSMDLTDVGGGLMGVATVITRHLEWEFSILEWDLALRIPGSEDWFLFQKSPGQRLDCCLTGLSLDDLNWRYPGPGHLLATPDGPVGELRLSPGVNANIDDLGLYLRFAADAFNHYCLHSAVLEIKAHTLDALPLGVGRLDSRGRLLEANPSLRDFIGLDAYAGLDMMTLMHRARSMPLDTSWTTFLSDPAQTAYSRIFCPMLPTTANAKDCFYISAYKTVREGFPEILFLIENVSDVTDLQTSALRQRDFLERLLDSMRDIALTIDPEGRITYASPRWSDKLVGRNFFRITKPIGAFTGPWTPAILKEASAPGVQNPADKPVELVMLVNEFKALPVEAIFSPLKANHVPNPDTLVVCRDLSTIRRLEDELKRQAIYDGLTGIYNHFQFNVLMEREALRSRRTRRLLGLLFFDLDGFKKVNDNLGHQFGDKVLSGVGRILRENCRSGTDFPCRYGGDEFAVIVTELNPVQMELLANRLIDKVRTELEGKVGLSLGLSTLQPSEHHLEMVRRADKAVFVAKAQGGNRFVWAEGEQHEK